MSVECRAKSVIYDTCIILAIRNILIHFNYWTSNSSMNFFDITMRACNSVQVTDLVGLFLLFQNKQYFTNFIGGLYKNDACLTAIELFQSRKPYINLPLIEESGAFISESPTCVEVKKVLTVIPYIIIRLSR